MDKRRNIKVVFFSDSHLGLDYKVNKSNDLSKGEDYFKNFIEVIRRAKEIKADLLIHGGDLFHKADVHQKVIDRCYDEFYSAAEQMQCVIIPGNHEKSNLPESLFTSHPNLHICNDDTQFNYEFNNLKIELSAIPFKRKIRKALPESLEKFKYHQEENKYNILLLHQSIEGAKVGPVNYQFRYGLETIGPNQIPEYFDLVLSGHIHRYQTININKANKTIPFIYCGSTEKTSFAEKNEQKGFLILEFKKKAISPEIRFEKLHSRPMYDILIEEKLISQKHIRTFLESKAKNIEGISIVRIDCKFDESKLLLNQKLLGEIFSPNTTTVIKGISAMYTYPKYLKKYDK